MKLFRILSAAAVACLMVFTIVACGDTGGGGTGPGTMVTIPDAVSGLQATSIDDATVRLRWTAVSSSTVSVTGYRVTVLSSTGSVIGTATPTNPIVDVSGLTAGRVYTFRVQTRTRDTVSAERTINWSPAQRIRMASGGPVRLYESASSFGSGLAFQGGVAQNLTVANASRWDIGLDTEGNSFDIGSPNKTSYQAFRNNGGRRTLVSGSIYTPVDSLNQVFDTQFSAGSEERLITFTNANRGFVMAVRTQDGNFAKVFVRASASGVLLQGTAPNRYVEVEISYQPVANVPYAVQFNKAAEAVLQSEMNAAGLYFTAKKVSSQKD